MLQAGAHQTQAQAENSGGVGGRAPNVVWDTNEKYQQLFYRLALPHLRDTLERLRCRELSAEDAAVELEVSRSRIYTLLSDYLRAFATGRHATWEPGRLAHLSLFDHQNGNIHAFSTWKTTDLLAFRGVDELKALVGQT